MSQVRWFQFVAFWVFVYVYVFGYIGVVYIFSNGYGSTDIVDRQNIKPSDRIFSSFVNPRWYGYVHFPTLNSIMLPKQTTIDDQLAWLIGHRHPKNDSHIDILPTSALRRWNVCKFRTHDCMTVPLLLNASTQCKQTAIITCFQCSSARAKVHNIIFIVQNLKPIAE